MTTPEEFVRIMDAPEGSRLEFKEARNRYEFDDLVRYCVALANEGGGKIILGVTDRRPRRVVGTSALPEPGRTEAGIFERIGRRVSLEEFMHDQQRVLIVHVPARVPGTAWSDRGSFWMRAGESLVPMTDDQLRRIHAEADPDFSGEVCAKATLSDLSPAAIAEFRARWRRRSGNAGLDQVPDERLLRDAELIVDAGVTYAALVLFGTRAGLGHHLAQAEVVFEYRSNEAPGPAQQRKEYREGFFTFQDDLWSTINLRNDLQHFQSGLFMLDVATFNEGAVREAILNAVAHRDYRLPGSVFVRQYQRRIEIASPGGFPPGISTENILWKQAPRNRRVAETLARAGLVERAGQGMDRIYSQCIRESKPLPDFSRTDDYEVWLTLHGEIQDPAFLKFLEKVGREQVEAFTTQDLLVLNLIAQGARAPSSLEPDLDRLLELGVIERVGRGRLILSRRYYSFIGRRGAYTRKKGLDRETNKALLFKHIQDYAELGSPLKDLMQVLPSQSRGQVRTLLQELRGEGKAHPRGKRKGARWFPGSEAAYGSGNDGETN